MLLPLQFCSTLLGKYPPPPPHSPVDKASKRASLFTSQWLDVYLIKTGWRCERGRHVKVSAGETPSFSGKNEQQPFVVGETPTDLLSPPSLSVSSCSIMARGCICCVKYMLFLFNLFFWLGGCGLLGVGVWLSVSQGSFATLSPSFPSLSAANLIITLGTVVMVTGFLGCLGAIKENKCLLLSFFIVLLIILLAELILLILFFVYTDKVSENARRDLKEGLVLYTTDNNAGLREAWNTIQGQWNCCGVMTHNDWYSAIHENVVPDSCCKQVYQGCGHNVSNASNNFWPTGCYVKVEEWLDENKHLLGTIAMCVLVVQLLGMAFSMTLYQQIHRAGKKYEA